MLDFKRIEMKKGTRVIHKDGSVGYIETIDNNLDYPIIDVRWLTPNNELSACVSMCRPKDLRPVLDHVVPMQRNAAWWEEARKFCLAIENALYSAKI